MRVLMTGGGTGGHINPALAIANIIKQREPDSEIAFVGTSRGLENKLVPKEGYELYHIEVRGLRRSLSPANIRSAYLAITSISKAKKLIKKFKPDICIGTGGYVSWPLIKAASELGIPTALHESNALPGVAVKMLAKSTDIIFTNFEETRNLINEKYREKTVRVGNPLRGSFSNVNHEDARKKLGYENKYTQSIISLGGSLGAEKINENVLEMMKNYVSKHPEIHHLHATGHYGYEDFMKKFKESGLDKYENLEPVEYIFDMPTYMSAADLVINRAGAMTISELAKLGKPTILIPSPNVTDNHQYKNAKVLEDAEAAVLIEEKNLNSNVLTENAVKILENREKSNKLSRNFHNFAISDTDELIYSGIKKLVISKKM